MKWLPRLVSPKEQSTDACCQAFCDRVDQRENPTYSAGREVQEWVERGLTMRRSLPVFPYWGTFLGLFDVSHTSENLETT
jgi:hypothetical protein